jgi:hypothetical protein
MNTTAQKTEDVWTATGHERPVFFDEHGRRRRWVFAGGALTGGMSALWLGGLLAGAIGFASLPVPHGITPALSRAAPVVSSLSAQDRDRVGRQANVLASVDEHAVTGRQIEARASGRTVHLPAVLRGGKLPLRQRS